MKFRVLLFGACSSGLASEISWGAFHGVLFTVMVIFFESSGGECGM